jgi:hypothetical protein
MTYYSSKAPYCVRTAVNKETIDHFLITTMPQEAANPNQTLGKYSLVDFIEVILVIK